jgi:hypothetical protein
MPITSGRGAGSQSVAKAGVNLEYKSGVMVANQVSFTDTLDTPGMPRLTWIVVQESGAVAISVQPQISVRRGDVQIGGGGAVYIFMPIGPPTIVQPGVPTVFEFNAPCQAIRLSLTTPVGLAANTTTTVVLMASG